MNKQQRRERIFLVIAILFAVAVVVYTSITGAGMEDAGMVLEEVMPEEATQEEMASKATVLESDTSEDGVIKKKSSQEYTFYKTNDEEQIWGTSKLCDIYGIWEYDESPLAYGQMLTLFGEPLYTTENLENQYSYIISAVDEEGNEFSLHVYSGPTGPSIGGNKDVEGTKEAARALVRYIKEAKPTDYEYAGYYMDAPSKVIMGVKDKEPYMSEEILNLTEEEFAALYERLYGLE